MAKLSVLDFFVPVAILGNILLGAVNLHTETKSDDEQVYKWGLAAAQFIMIALALLLTLPRYSSILLVVLVLLSVGAGLLAWQRFKRYENSRIAFVAAQGLANLLFLLHFGYEWKKYKNEMSLATDRVTLKTTKKMIVETEKEIKKINKEIDWLRNSRRPEKEQLIDKKLNEIEIYNNKLSEYKALDSSLTSNEELRVISEDDAEWSADAQMKKAANERLKQAKADGRELQDVD